MMQIWLSVLEITVSNNEKQFQHVQWKVIHNTIFTEHKLYLMNMSDGLWHFCKETTENLTHILYNNYCRKMNWLIREIENKINVILDEKC